MELPQRLELERKFSTRLYTLHSRHRDELRRYLDDGLDLAAVPAEFWAKVRRENETELVAILMLLFGLSANYHVALAGHRFRPLKPAVDLMSNYWAGDRGRLVADAMTQTAQKRLTAKVEKLRTTLEPRTATQTRQIISPVGIATVDEPPTPIVAPDISPEIAVGEELDRIVDEIFSEAHAEFVAMSEATAAQSAGGDEGVRLTVGISVLDRWRTNPGRLPGSLKLSRSGPCPTCLPMDGVRRFGWIDPRGPGPWIHPGCVCDILYHNIEAQRETERVA